MAFPAYEGCCNRFRSHQVESEVKRGGGEEVWFAPEEAELVALLTIKPFTAETAARLWKKKPETWAHKILGALASRDRMLEIDSRPRTPLRAKSVP